MEIRYMRPRKHPSSLERLLAQLVGKWYERLPATFVADIPQISDLDFTITPSA